MRSPTTGEFVATELETQRTLPQDSHVRQFLNDKYQGKYEADRVLKRDKEHSELDEAYLEKCVDEILESEEVDETFTRNEVKERILRKFEENKEIMEPEQIKEDAKKDLEYDAEMLNREKNR